MMSICEALPSLKAALAVANAAVLVAPPGAGKSTVVPLALLHEPWVAGRKLIMLEPRRLAARAAAARMALSLGEPVGRTVGFRVRLQSCVSDQTRVEVVTEGLFTRMILGDAGLEGVAAVIFDEFHERSLDADLGLAFARDAQRVLRADLRLLVMSATLDAAPVAALLDDAPVVESLGQAFPVQTRYLGGSASARLEEVVVRAIRLALSEEGGDILVFLPGAGEIRRTENLLTDRLGGREDLIVAPLYGALSSGEQDRALEPAPPGVRKVVLATSIAQTSLTLVGVRVVIDAGLSRVPRFHPSSGLTRLETVRVSRASADQRRGRAGRTQPGLCYRLWDEPQTRALAAHDRPEILESDLAGVALLLAQWGAKDPSGLAFLDPPPAAAFAEARSLLGRLGALDGDGALTEHGRRLADLPLPPRLAQMVVEGSRRGLGERAALIAALASDRGLGGTAVCVSDRLERLATDASPRGQDARALAHRWARQAGSGSASGPSSASRTGAGAGRLQDGLLVALAYPERIAKTRGVLGQFRMANGRGVQLDPGESLARETWLAVAELGGGAARDRILLAAPIDRDELLAAMSDQLTSEVRVEADAQGRFRARRVRSLGELPVEDRVLDRPDPELITAALMAQVRAQGLGVLPRTPAIEQLRARVRFLRELEGEPWPDLGDAALLASLHDWLPPLLTGRSALIDVPSADLEQGLLNLVPWALQRRLDLEAPERFAAPGGSTPLIDYAAEGGPRVEVRVQELFGLSAHPTVAHGRQRLSLALLSPARRPVQVTQDLPGFWAGSWKAVRSEMRGRYPRHPWPENPLEAPPTNRAKPRA